MQRRAILVLGMHRSGTSALTRVLAALGACLPKTLMPPNGSNPAGYWESLPVNHVLELILQAAGSSWQDWRPFDPCWHRTEGAAVLIEKLRDAICSEFADAPLLVIKDPRICRLAPLVGDVLKQLSIEPCAVIMMRHPTEVVDSLYKRDQMPRERAGHLWLRHVLDAERSTREWRRVFLDYDQLLDDWEAVATRTAEILQLQWPRELSSARTEIDAFLSRELRHHTADPGEVAWTDAPWCERAYRLIRGYARDGADLTCSAAFDELSEQLTASSHDVQDIAAQQSAPDNGALSSIDTRPSPRSAENIIPHIQVVFPAVAAQLARSDGTPMSAEVRRLIDLYIGCWPFDEEQYLNLYPDVRAAVQDGGCPSAWEHFRRFGYIEGRLPRQVEVDEGWYLSTYPEVAREIHAGIFINAQQHFVDRGYREGRLPRRPRVQPDWYASRYAQGAGAEQCEAEFLERGYRQAAIPEAPQS
jgi:hypothetical protein